VFCAFDVLVFADRFAASPQDMTVVMGQSARFCCSIEAVPAASISWQKNGQNFTTDDDHRFINSRFYVLLT